MAALEYGQLVSWTVLAAVCATNVYALLVSFRYRIRIRFAALCIGASEFLLLPLLIWPYLPWPIPPLFHWVHFLLLIVLAKGSIASMGYFHCMICALTMFFRVAASFIVEPFTGYGSNAYYTAWAALVFVMLGGYSAFVRRYGVEWRDSLEGHISTFSLTLFALISMVCWQTLKEVYIVPGKASPVVPLRPDLGFIVMPFALAGLIVAIGASYLFAQRRATDQIELRLAQSALSAGHSHYEKLAELNASVRAIRHDNRHHMATLQTLLATGNVAEAQAYLDEMQQQSAATELKTYCGSQVINALLNSFAARCESDGIAFEPHVELPSFESGSEYELCIILGNLLENAVRGCGGTSPDMRKYIDIVIRPQRDQYGIMVKNSFSGRIFEDERGILSTKPGAIGAPGIGIQSVRAIAKRHGGEYYPSWKDNVFTAYVVLQKNEAERSAG